MTILRSGLSGLFIVAILVALSGSSAGQAQSSFALGFLLPDAQGENLSFPRGLFLTSTSSPNGTFEEEVVRLINEARRAKGVPPLSISPALTSAAYSHSSHMRDQGCFSHQCEGEASASSRACEAGYEPYGWGACYIGETIAAGFQTPASVVDAWLASSGHYGILLDSALREIGVGYVSGGSYGYYWTADFGSQPDVIPVFANGGDPTTDSREITLTLTNEEVSGWGGIDFADEVMISTNPDFSGAQWEPFSREKQWTLPEGNGTVTIYVKYRDAAGNEVVSTTSIVLDAPIEYDLELSTHSLFFIYEVGSGFWSSPVGRIGVMNSSGVSSMAWNASGGAAWVGFVPGSGSTPGELQVSVEGFSTDIPGDSQAAITVVSPQSPDEPEEVMVTVRAVGQAHRVMLPFVAR
jgi:uncharacterized protein YkwD